MTYRSLMHSMPLNWPMCSKRRIMHTRN